MKHKQKAPSKLKNDGEIEITWTFHYVDEKDMPIEQQMALNEMRRILSKGVFEPDDDQEIRSKASKAD